jgi:hypothetical protein
MVHTPIDKLSLFLVTCLNPGHADDAHPLLRTCVLPHIVGTTPADLSGRVFPLDDGTVIA